MSSIASLQQHDQAAPIQSLFDDNGYAEFLSRFAGHMHTGMPQRTLPKFNKLKEGIHSLISFGINAANQSRFGTGLVSLAFLRMITKKIEG